MITVISRQDQTATLSLIESPGYILGKTAFASKNIFLQQDQDKIFLATDKKLIRIDIK